MLPRSKWLRVPPKYLVRLSVRILRAMGVPHDEARLVTNSLLQANMTGFDSEGVPHLFHYVSEIRKGNVRSDTKPITEFNRGAVAKIDGNGAFGQLALLAATRIAVEKALKDGIGLVAIGNCGHYGRPGEWVELAAHQGLDCMMFSRRLEGETFPSQLGQPQDRALDIHPVAFAAPAKGVPLVIDLVAKSFDSYDDLPLPLRENKSAILSVMMEFLTCGLALSDFALHRTQAHTFLLCMEPTMVLSKGQFLRATDGSGHWMRRVGLLEEHKIQETQERIRRTRQERQEEGIPIQRRTWTALLSLAKELNVELEYELQPVALTAHKQKPDIKRGHAFLL